MLPYVVVYEPTTRDAHRLRLRRRRERVTARRPRARRTRREVGTAALELRSEARRAIDAGCRRMTRDPTGEDREVGVARDRFTVATGAQSTGRSPAAEPAARRDDRQVENGERAASGRRQASRRSERDGADTTTPPGPLRRGLESAAVNPGPHDGDGQRRAHARDPASARTIFVAARRSSTHSGAGTVDERTRPNEAGLDGAWSTRETRPLEGVRETRCRSHRWGWLTPKTEVDGHSLDGPKPSPASWLPPRHPSPPPHPAGWAEGRHPSPTVNVTGAYSLIRARPGSRSTRASCRQAADVEPATVVPRPGGRSGPRTRDREQDATRAGARRAHAPGRPAAPQRTLGNRAAAPVWNIAGAHERQGHELVTTRGQRGADERPMTP